MGVCQIEQQNGVSIITIHFEIARFMPITILHELQLDTPSGRQPQLFTPPVKRCDQGCFVNQEHAPFPWIFILNLEQCRRKRVRVKRSKVVHLFPYAHKPHRDAERRCDRDNDPALGRAIELGQDDAGKPRYI